MRDKLGRSIEHNARHEMFQRGHRLSSCPIIVQVTIGFPVDTYERGCPACNARGIQDDAVTGNSLCYFHVSFLLDTVDKEKARLNPNFCGGRGFFSLCPVALFP